MDSKAVQLPFTEKKKKILESHKLMLLMEEFGDGSRARSHKKTFYTKASVIFDHSATSDGHLLKNPLASHPAAVNGVV